MKTLMLLLVSFCLSIANECSAQVYVFAREDKADIVQNFNSEDGGAKLKKQLIEREGKWFSLLETDSAGHGAIFCVANPDGLNPKYFLSFGKVSPAEAIVEARSKAQDYSRGKSNFQVFIMRTFNNLNKYPLRKTH